MWAKEHFLTCKALTLWDLRGLTPSADRDSVAGALPAHTPQARLLGSVLCEQSFSRSEFTGLFSHAEAL